MNDAAIATLKKNGTYLVPTLYLLDWHREHAEEAHLPDYARRKMDLVAQTAKGNAKKAFEAGVKIGMGTDAAVYPHGLNAHEIAVYVTLGMSPLQAIQTATINDADLLGWSDKVGTIEPGKWPDIIAHFPALHHEFHVLKRVCKVSTELARQTMTHALTGRAPHAPQIHTANYYTHHGCDREGHAE
jgi:imidazolonepropionase-like amidohydrolase